MASRGPCRFSDRPSGNKASRTCYDVPADKQSRLVAVHHRRADDTIVKEARQPPPTATVIMGRGGLSSTASDYIRFVRMILNDASRTPVRPTIHGRLRNFRFEAIERLPAKFACPAYLGDFYRRIAVRYL